jgi:hypothetical protein
MAQITPAANFDGNPGIQFCQGEDRSILMTLYDQVSGQPVDLATGSPVVEINLPLNGGGSIKRTTGVVTALCANVSPTPANSVSLTDHGFVTGDPVEVAATGGSTLPGGLTASTPYLINVLDNNDFQFTNPTTGAVISLTSQGSGSFTITNTTPDLAITTGLLGQVTFTLRALVSAAVNAGLAQSFQVSFTISGLTRIVVVQNLLNILNQPVP